MTNSGSVRSLAGKVALVTGAGRGIGRSIALALADQGAAVAVVARTRSDVDRVAAEIVAKGGRAVASVADVSVSDQVEASIRETNASLGAVDVLVNNAGHNILGHIEQMDMDAWWGQIEVNLRGAYLYCRATVPKMVEKRWGRIINISSVAGKIGLLYCTAYCSAKHALIGLTRALALELAEKGVTVNAICPGYVETDLTEQTYRQRSELFGIPVDQVLKQTLQRIPQKVAMKPDDMVPSVLFLASPAAERITGEAMNVSAGLVMH